MSFLPIEKFLIQLPIHAYNLILVNTSTADNPKVLLSQHNLIIKQNQEKITSLFTLDNETNTEAIKEFLLQQQKKYLFINSVALDSMVKADKKPDILNMLLAKKKKIIFFYKSDDYIKEVNLSMIKYKYITINISNQQADMNMIEKILATKELMFDISTVFKKTHWNVL